MAPYKKRLEGVRATKELRELFQAAKRSDATISNTSNTKTDTSNGGNNDECYVPGRPLTVPEAASLLQNFQLLEKDHFPIRVVRAMHVILKADPKKKHLGDQLDTAVRRPGSGGGGGLVFTPPPPAAADDESEIAAHDDDDDDDDPNLTPEERQYRRRMRRLRWRREQAKYAALTQNLKSMTAAQPDDGITTKSMTYAASVGLNMIVAPLSFGVFMYFFAGAVLDKFWPDDGDRNNNNNTTDIKRVIAGVVSGVLMLFIEMLLFVIRTHEMDRALRRKQRQSDHRQQQHQGGGGPFGYYTATTSRTYKDR